MPAHVPSFGRNPRGSPDFLAYPVPKACMHVLGTRVPRRLGVARSASSPKAAQALGCSLTPGLRISFGRVTCIARAASVPGLWALGFLLLACVCGWVRVAVGRGFCLPLPVVAGVLGGCVWARFVVLSLFCWLFVVFVVGLWCRPAFGTCVVSCAFPLPPAVSGSGVRCGRACWARVSAVPRPSWLGCRVVFFALFFLFFFSVAGCPCPRPCGPSPRLLSFGLGCWLFFFFVSACFGAPFPGGALFLAWCCRFWLGGPPVPVWGSCLRCPLRGGFGPILCCWRAVWWLWAVLAPPPLFFSFFWGGGGLAVPPFAFSRLALALWLVCGVVGPSPLLAEVPVCHSPPLLVGFRCRWWWAVPATPGWGLPAAVVCGVWRWCVGGVVAGVWCGWSLATPGGGSCVLLPATPGWVSLPVVVGGPRHSWLGSVGGVAVWCVVFGGGVLVGLWLVRGVVGPSPLLAEVPVCYSPPLLAGFRCRWWWAVPATPGWGPLAALLCGVCCVAVVCWWGCGWCVVWLVPRHSWRWFLCATPRHSWLGFAAGGGGRSPPLLAGVRWRRRCVVCGGGVLLGLWLVCGVVGPSPLLAVVPVCYSPPLLAGFRCRWWWAVPATPGWGPLAAVVCGVWCVVCGGGVLVGLWLVCGVVGPSPLLAEVPVRYSPPLLAGFRCRWWWAVPATPGWGPLAASLCGVWCVVCGGGVLVGLWLVCGVVGPSPLLAEVPVRYSPPLLVGFRCRWWWAVPATPGWGPLAASVCGVWRWCVVGVVVGVWCGWSLATPGGGPCVLLPATPGWVSLPLVVGGPRHSWLGSVGGGGVWCVVCCWGPWPLLAEVPVCYPPPLLAGFCCRWWWAVPATPGWGLLAAVVCVLCLAGSGGPASRARSGAPHLFLWPLCLSALLGPLRAGVAPLSFAAVAVPRWLFFSASRCLARASFVSPAWPLAALWWLLPRPRPPLCLAVFVAPACGLGVFFFFFFFLRAPPLSPAFSGFRPRVPWASALALFVLLAFRFSALSALVPLSAWLLAAPAWLLPPPPPLCLAVLVPAARCCVPCCAVHLWVRCCAALLRVVSPGVVLLCAVLRSFRAAACCAVPSGAARCPGALCSAALCFVVFPRAVCSVLCVFCRGAVVRAVVRRSALCCVCLGVLCCAFPVPSFLCGAVLRCAGALALCCSCGACCCWRLVLWCAAVCCAVSCGVPWCGAGSGGPWLSAGGVFRCRCPCLAAWSASLWLVWFAVVPCFPVSCSVVLCCRVVLCCCALLSCCGAVGACFALLWAVVLCCVVLLVGCAVSGPVVVSACCGALFLALCVPCLLRSVRCGALLCWLCRSASLCRVLWRCAVVWCCAVVLCCRFAVLFVFALPSCGLSCGACVVYAVVGASCCGVCLCVVVSPWAFCGVVVLLWCVEVSCCAVRCPVMSCALCRVLRCRAVLRCCAGWLCCAVVCAAGVCFSFCPLFLC